MIPTNFNNTLPHSFGSSWKNLPPNFFGKNDESNQMRKQKEELVSDKLQRGHSSAGNVFSIITIIATSLGLMKVRGMEVMGEENQTLFYTQLPKSEVENTSPTGHDSS